MVSHTQEGYLWIQKKIKKKKNNKLLELEILKKNEVWLEKQKPTDIPEQQVYDCYMWLKFEDY